MAGFELVLNILPCIKVDNGGNVRASKSDIAHTRHRYALL